MRICIIIFVRQIVLMKSNEDTNGLPSIFDYSGRGWAARWDCPPLCEKREVGKRFDSSGDLKLEASGCGIVQAKMCHTNALELVVFQIIDAPICGDVDVASFHGPAGKIGIVL